MSHPPCDDTRLARAFCAIVAVTALATWAWVTHHVVTRCGELAMPLDDSYIHFQYARALAELRPFQYTVGQPPTPGATSLLWPTVLAPAWALGARGMALAWPATALGFAALAGLAIETRRLARGLVPEPLATSSGLLVFCFAPFTWFAGSGMEVVPFAWLLMRTARKLAEYAETGPGVGKRRSALGHAALCILARPEGVLACLGAAGVFAIVERGRARAWASGALALCALPNALYWACTGSAFASTAMAKWLPLNPYSRETLSSDVGHNVALLFETLLDGREWSWIFVPEGGRAVAWASLVALLWRGRVRPWRAGAVLVLALGILVPTTYETFLVNRLRYLWPFAGAWLLALVVLVDVATQAFSLASRRRVPQAWLRGAALLAVAGFGAAFAGKLPRALDDLAESADAIDDQQVSMGRWVRDHLPKSAVVGVNDTGAIAYVGERTTFDVVGLTTAGEAAHWTAGAGSRFEHYERLGAARLPDYFVVYPEWFAIPQLLGPRLTERYVDATILGGREKVAYPASYDALSSGALPQSTTGTVLDELDVSDLTSEREHGYVLGRTSKEDNRVFSSGGIVDAGRARRQREDFALQIAGSGTVVLRVVVDGTSSMNVEIGSHAATPGVLEGWQEIRLAIPENVSGTLPVQVSASTGTFALLHAWSLGPTAGP